MRKINRPSVAIDILHYPHLNLYKHAIEILKEKNIHVNVILRPRGNLISIFQKECPDVHFVLIGKHRKNIFGKMYDLIEREIALLRYLHKIKSDVSTAAGSEALTHANFFLRKPSVIFVDDVEYKLANYLTKPFATYFVLPAHVPGRGKNLLKYNGFKELAYLHPNHFKPNKKALEPYNLNPYEYVFIREVSSVSLNYRNLEMGRLSKILDYLKKMDLQILLSIEDKTLINLFEDYCIVLKEPVEDIYSLLHYAILTVSSGDSMARESCLVGTPAIYTGGRYMAINNELIKRSCMFKVNGENQIKDTIKYLIEKEVKKEVEVKIRRAIKQEWVDTTEVILDLLMGTIYDDYSLIEKYKV